MSWQHIRGHDSQVQAFREAQRKGRLAHAYLFTGPPGIGKRLFAGELAKSLLCETSSPEQLEACDSCPGCIQAGAGTHPDLFLAGRPEDSQDLPIETVRELCRGLSLKPARGRGKVAIVDDADDLNDAAANCFLKTLEEPPPGSLLILIGTSPDRQLPTIVSRCQVLRFMPLAEEVVTAVLRQQGFEQGIERLSRLAGGSPGQAIALADPELWAFRKSFLLALARPRCDTVALSREWLRFVETAGKESAKQRRRAGLVLRLLIDFLKDAVRLAHGAVLSEKDAEFIEAMEGLNQQLEPDELLDLIERCLEADRHLDRNVQLVLALEALVDAVGSKTAAV